MRRKIKILEGMIFGKLVTVRPSQNKGPGGRILWVCLCDCGVEVDVRPSQLIAENPNSWKRHCGCVMTQRDRLVNVEKYTNFHKTMVRYIVGAEKRGIEWGLSVEESMGLFTSECHYCGCPPATLGYRIKTQQPILYNGIDRLDSRMGYFSDNCVSCCSRCNHAKGSMHIDEFLKFIKEVYEHRIKK